MNFPEMSLLKGVVFFLVLLVSLYAPTKASAGGLEIAPIGGYTFSVGNEDSPNGNNLDLADSENQRIIQSQSARTGPGRFYELLYSHQLNNPRDDGTVFSGAPRLNLDIDTTQLGGAYGTEGERVNPFVAAGLGITHMSSEQGDAETWFTFSLEAGGQIPLTQNTRLRFEGTGFVTVREEGGSFF